VREENEQKASCPRAEGAAAYLDGELDAAETLLFESHLRECPACAAAVRQQRRLLCLLDTAFGARHTPASELPKDFARVVTARAQTDMSGVRRKSEHRTALKICLALAVASFALTGAAAFDVILRPILRAARAFGGLLGMFGHALFDAASGAVQISRAFGSRLVSDPDPFSYLQWAFLAGAALLLLRLIGNYHRARVNDQENF
jgi:anti-sigma factor RsiW